MTDALWVIGALILAIGIALVCVAIRSMDDD